MIFASCIEKLRKLRRNEDGSASMEFVILFPLLAFILILTIELGLVLMRGALLERSLDMAVRELRLNTGVNMQHDEFRDLVCARAGSIDNCLEQVRIELVQVDPFGWSQEIDPTPDCINSVTQSGGVTEVNPVREFKTGQSNELMYIRACLRFTPMLGGVGIGAFMEKDDQGRVKLFAASAYVQEPR